MIMSKIQLSPYVNFQGRAREAMEFYHKVLGGKLDLKPWMSRAHSSEPAPGRASGTHGSRPTARSLSPRTATPTTLPKSATTWPSPWAARTKTGSPKSSTIWPKAANARCRWPSSPGAPRWGGSRTNSAFTGRSVSTRRSVAGRGEAGHRAAKWSLSQYTNWRWRQYHSHEYSGDLSLRRRPGAR